MRISAIEYREVRAGSTHARSSENFAAEGFKLSIDRRFALVSIRVGAFEFWRRANFHSRDLRISKCSPALYRRLRPRDPQGRGAGSESGYRIGSGRLRMGNVPDYSAA